MAKPIIYLAKTFRKNFLEQIAEIAVQYDVKTEIEQKDLANIEVVVGWDKKLCEGMLSNNSSLRWVQAISAGVDYLPLKHFAEKGVLLSNASGIHSIAISEHVIGIILSYYRGLISSVQAQEKKEWMEEPFFYDQASGKKMLVIGTGHIGQNLAGSVKSLGIEAYGINTAGHPAENFIETYSYKNMLKIVEEMDIVVNILPLTEETHGIYNTDFFHAMKDSGVFINVGRGQSVNVADLKEALENRIIRFAALDVFSEEPLSADSSLWEINNLLITSHISGMSRHFQQKFMDIFLPNLKTYCEEKKLITNIVDLNKGY